MLTIRAVHGDITEQAVDAIVNPAILRDCIARFPHGLATGDAGWTIAGNPPAR